MAYRGGGRDLLFLDVESSSYKNGWGSLVFALLAK